MKNYSALACLCSLTVASAAPAVQNYSTCQTWQELVSSENFRFAPVVRVSDPGTRDRPAYTGFWFFGVLQFDPTGQYALAMKVPFQNRDVTPADRGEIGYIDLRNQNQWTKIGETTAWNWQQGCRLQWRPRSNEILWNDRAEDGSHFVCRAFNFKTSARRTLPRPIYDVLPDGAFALTHDFQRMKHGGTAYVGIPDSHEGDHAPAEAGVEKMDLNTGEVQLILSLQRVAQIAFPQGYAADTDLYFFREGWNPSGTRFIAFLKNSSKPTYTGGWSISADGRDVRFFYNEPSHHAWLDDSTILEGHNFLLYKDDGSGEVTQRLAGVEANADPTVVPGQDGQWFLGDTYPLNGFQHLYLFHRPSRLFVPLARLKNTARSGNHRIDLHARTSHDGRIVCVDGSHEGLGRQMYIVQIGYILDHPPAPASAP